MVSIISTIGQTIKLLVKVVNIKAPIRMTKEMKIVLPMLSPASLLTSGQISTKTAPFKSEGFTLKNSVGRYSFGSKSSFCHLKS